ncbi:MAG: MBL fold metallo-hydrolase [Nitrospirae bacterium]|nr:MBL fold metallo-hydrolase [Nitrospirota bacterium]
MKIDTIVVGPLQANCYIIYDEATLGAMVVDPGADSDLILGRLSEKGMRLERIICTHGHFDHIGAVSDLKKKTGAGIVLNREDLEIYQNADELASMWGYDFVQPPDPDMYVREGDTLSLGRNRFQVLHTPGHSPGGICLLTEGTVITGDTVFAGSIGRTDFYGGSLEAMKKSFIRVISLPDRTLILPGHGPRSTVGNEKETNFFMHEI